MRQRAHLNEDLVKTPLVNEERVGGADDERARRGRRQHVQVLQRQVRVKQVPLELDESKNPLHPATLTPSTGPVRVGTLVKIWRGRPHSWGSSAEYFSAVRLCWASAWPSRGTGSPEEGDRGTSSPGSLGEGFGVVVDAERNDTSKP